MKIAYISPLPPEASGIANYAARFKTALETGGVQVTTPLSSVDDLTTMQELNSRAESLVLNDVDLVHFELGGGRIRHFLMLERLQKLYPDLPMTATVHDPERLAWRAWGLGRFEGLPRKIQQGLTLLTNSYSVAKEKQAAHRLNKMVTLTNMGAQVLKNKMNLPSKMVQAIPHAVTDVPRKPLPSTSPIKILFFGYIHAGKGIECLIDAVSEVKKHNPHLLTRLSVTISGGSAPSMNISNGNGYLGALKAQIDKAMLSDIIQIDTDIPEEQLADFIQRHHVMVLPYQDSKKISLLGKLIASSGATSWAIACGRGLLVSNARALHEDVAFNNGAVFNQNSPHELANELIKLAESPSVLTEWANNAYALAQSRFWEQIAGDFIQVFENALLDTQPRAQTNQYSIA